MDIEFTPDESFEQHRRNVVWVTAIDDEKVIECAISIEALSQHFGAHADDPLHASAKHRQQVWDIASNLIADRRFVDGGTILIHSAELSTFPYDEYAPPTLLAALP